MVCCLFCRTPADFVLAAGFTVTATLLNFIRLFRKAHDENIKQAEADKKKAEKEAEMEKAKSVNSAPKSPR